MYFGFLDSEGNIGGNNKELEEKYLKQMKLLSQKISLLETENKRLEDLNKQAKPGNVIF